MPSPESPEEDKLKSCRADRARRLLSDVVSVNKLQELYEKEEDKEGFLEMIREHRLVREEIMQEFFRKEQERKRSEKEAPHE